MIKKILISILTFIVFYFGFKSIMSIFLVDSGSIKMLALFLALIQSYIITKGFDVYQSKDHESTDQSVGGVFRFLYVSACMSLIFFITIAVFFSPELLIRNGVRLFPSIDLHVLQYVLLIIPAIVVYFVSIWMTRMLTVKSNISYVLNSVLISILLPCFLYFAATLGLLGFMHYILLVGLLVLLSVLAAIAGFNYASK